jgi:hypothetical protein
MIAERLPLPDPARGESFQITSKKVVQEDSPAYESRESHPVNRKIKKSGNGVWGEDEVPITRWENTDARVVVTPELRDVFHLNTDVIRRDAIKYQDTLNEHEHDVHVIRSLSTYMENWQYAGLRKKLPDGPQDDRYKVLFQDEQKRWYSAVIGYRDGYPSLITIFGSGDKRFLGKSRRGLEWEVERGK